MTPRLALLTALLAGLVLLNPGGRDAGAQPAKGGTGFLDKPNAEQLAFFEKKIRPVLVEHCYECHSAESKKVKGGLTLDTRDGFRRGGDSLMGRYFLFRMHPLSVGELLRTELPAQPVAPAAPLEGLELNQRITDKYYADLSAQLAA